MYVHQRWPLSAVALTLALTSVPIASAQVVELGQSCGIGSATPPTLGVVGAPIDGETFGIEFGSDPAADSILILAGLSKYDPPVDLASAGYAGCQLHVNPAFVVPATPDQDGKLAFVVPTWAAGLTLYLQGIPLAQGSALGFTHGLAITSMPKPSNDGVSDFSPTSGAAGSEITVVGSGFAPASYGAGDVYIKGTGNRGFYGRSSQVLGTGVVGELFHTAKYPEPTPVELHFGDGADVTMTPVFGAQPDGPAWVWTADSTDPVFTSVGDFHAIGSSIFGDCDQESLYTLDLKFELVNGELVLHYPDNGAGSPAPLCLTDRVSIFLGFTRSNGDDVVIRAAFVPEVTDWSLFGIAMVQELQTVFLSQTNNECFIGSFTGTTLTIKCSSGNPITAFDYGSNVRIKMEVVDHQQESDMGGIEDAFAQPIELTTPDPAWDAFAYNRWIAPAIGVHFPRMYDTTGYNKHFWDTLDNYSQLSSGPVRNACLELRIKGDSSQTYTDAVIVGWTGNTAAPWNWSTSLNVIPADGQWNPGDDATLKLDLSQLPNANGTTTNVLDALADGSLEIAVVDDTVVDFARVTVVRCKP